MPKALTRQQLRARKEKAVRFVRDVLGDPERASEIEEESLESYAERRRIKILDNPKGVFMATKSELLERIRELEGENETLQSQLDEIGDIVAPHEDDEGNGEDDDKGEE